MRRNIIVAGVIAAGLVIAGCGSPGDTTAQAAISDAASTSSTSSCSSDVVTTYPDGRNGTAVYVMTPGPDVITVDLIYGNGYDSRLFQQIRAKDKGASFDFGDTGAPYAVIVSTNKLGVCTLKLADSQ